LPEDEFFEKEKELEKLTKLYVDKVEDVLKVKEKEILKI
jgi:ribosome recycling factor